MAVVRGDSANHNEPAVMGVSTADGEGMGVWGEAAHGSGIIGMSGTWHGVYGHSVSDHGVVGESDQGSGVVGVAKKWIGVYGESAEYEGVRGHSKSRDHGGVVAINEAGGAALFAKSTGPAGVFDGNVQIRGIAEVGGLVNAGVDVNSRIFALEREVSRLLSIVASLQPTGGGGAAGLGGSPWIGVELNHTGGTFSNLRIFGRGFNSTEDVEIQVESKSSTGGGSNSVTTKANASGNIDATVGVTCPAGVQYTHTARARGKMSGKLSNTAGLSC